MIHTVKLVELKPYEMRALKRDLRYFITHGIKITFLKKVVYIHCDSHLPYQCIFNIMYNFRDRLHCNQKTINWLSNYYPFELIFKQDEPPRNL